MPHGGRSDVSDLHPTGGIVGRIDLLERRRNVPGRRTERRIAEGTYLVFRPSRSRLRLAEHGDDVAARDGGRSAGPLPSAIAP
mmetsp:Transcript_58/g.69  ORF Transcript_58/g.69 Transcript_58/m.69 type:complete len:83 (+) Transcript_58:1456-1704(+)